jgi:hypothetical protein
MLRNKAGSDSLPVIDRRRLKFEQQEPGWNRRFSWAAGLEGMDQEGGGSESAYGGSEKGKERELERDRPSAKVVHALKLKTDFWTKSSPGGTEGGNINEGIQRIEYQYRMFSGER